MKRILVFFTVLVLGGAGLAQNTNLNDYSYVVVPEQFDFQNGKNQFQLNSMAKFYFEKNGFNAYLANVAPNANRCDGLYADVEELWTILGTKLQVVLKDCNNKEIFRGQEGKSKYKEYEKSYQDALRKAFNGFQALNVHQPEVVLFPDSQTVVSSEKSQVRETVQTSRTDLNLDQDNNLPLDKFSTYQNQGNTFLLRKTAEGYSLYQEAADADDGLRLEGKIIIMDNLIRYMDTKGQTFQASFGSTGALTVEGNDKRTIYTPADQ